MGVPEALEGPVKFGGQNIHFFFCIVYSIKKAFHKGGFIMKKILSLGLLLAVIFTAGLTSCKHNADEKLPGTWSSVATFYNYSNEPRITATGSQFDYKLENPLTAWNEIIPDGKFQYETWSLTKETSFTGFKAKASANSSSSGCGFAFCINRRADPDDSTKTIWSYYSLVIQDGSIFMKQHDNRTSTLLLNWTAVPSLKAEPEENKITVYTDTDGSIIIKINGEVAHAIRNPEFTKGEIGILGVLSGKDQALNKTITASYEFLDFQYQ